jgi:hypothetical protein
MYDRYSNDELNHYGVLGMRWGVRRYQNIDGSLTERGKDHREAYVKREQKRLNKLYDREQRRYDRKIARAEKRGESDRVAYLKQRKADAEATRKGTSDYIKDMTWEQIKADEAADREDLKKAAKVGLGVGLGAAGIATAGGVAAAVASGTITAPMVQQKIYEASQTKAFQEGKNWVDLGIQGYVGARGYVMGASVNAVLNNVDTNRLGEVASSVGTSAGKAAGQAAKEFTRTSGGLGATLGNAGAQAINNSVAALEGGMDPRYVNAAYAGAQYYNTYRGQR